MFLRKGWKRLHKTSERETSDENLSEAYEFIKKASNGKKYRIIITKNGKIIADWRNGLSIEKKLSMASAAKSLYSSILGIAVEEGKIDSLDSKLIDYYPEYMNINEGEGPKPGRYAKPEDRDITFRQLISNMSGYMKPGETPDSTFHYQTYGMNILSHAIAKTYGYYDSENPDRLPGFRKLLDDKIKNKIGGNWTYKYMNFDHPKGAKVAIFGNYTSVESNAEDMAKMGSLWLNWGEWSGEQIIPESYLKEATRTAPNIRKNCPPQQWKYGYAFWTNEYGLLWPDLPRDCYAAVGAGQKHIWVCPSLGLVVAQSPGVFRDHTDRINTGLLLKIINSIKNDVSSI